MDLSIEFDEARTPYDFLTMFIGNVKNEMELFVRRSDEGFSRKYYDSFRDLTQRLYDKYEACKLQTYENRYGEIETSTLSGLETILAKQSAVNFYKEITRFMNIVYDAIPNEINVTINLFDDDEIDVRLIYTIEKTFQDFHHIHFFTYNILTKTKKPLKGI